MDKVYPILTIAEADALRWAVNEALEYDMLPHGSIADVARRAVSRVVEAMGLEPSRVGRQVFGRRKTRH